MPDWGTERLDMNRKVRGILVSHFIDLGRLSFHVYPGKIMFRGSLVKLTGSPDDLTPDRVRTLFEEIEHLPNVRKVFAQFDNWRQMGGGVWLENDRQKKKEGKARPAAMSHGALDWRQGIGNAHTVEVRDLPTSRRD